MNYYFFRYQNHIIDLFNLLIINIYILRIVLCINITSRFLYSVTFELKKVN